MDLSIARLRRIPARLRRESIDLLELVLLPGLAVVLPWALCYRVYRWVSRFECLYRERWVEALRQAQAVGQVCDARLWARHARITALVDHADLYLVMSRTDRWLRRHVRREGDWPAPGAPFVGYTFHWGCGFWALRDLAASGLRAHPLVASLPPPGAGGHTVRDAYYRLRNRYVASTLGTATIDVGRDLRRVLGALRDGDAVIAAIDVPPLGAAAERVPFLDGEIDVPRAMYRLAIDRDLPALVFACGIDFKTGRRCVEVIPLARHDTPAALAREVFSLLSERVAAVPEAWHFWGSFDHFLPGPKPAKPETAVGVIDVVVPVYADLAATRRCIESVRSAEGGARFELVIIADAPPDAGVAEYCRSLEGCDGVHVLYNPDNLGFVASVNRGMALHPDRDVVLLNSDTEVPRGWLDRLVACADAHPDAGTLTPFSNNATICSYPWVGWSGDVPGGLGLAALDALFAKTLAGQVVELPVGVGSCLYVRRACIDATGLFDQAAFGRGYGEECDFCLRAERLGWRHLLCADVFVFHAGGASFGAEKLALSDAAQRVLDDRYPDYARRVLEFVERDPIQPLRERIDDQRIRAGVDEALHVASERRQERLSLKAWLHDVLRRLDGR